MKKKDVHVSTLGALVRELMSEGKVIPAAAFDCFEVDAADSPTGDETVTTRREETRPDGTRIVTTVTKTKTVRTVRKETP